MYFISKNISRFLLLAVFVLGNASLAFATDDPWLTRPLKGSINSFHRDSISNNIDTKYFSLSALEKQHTVTHIINNLVGVGIEEESSYFIPGNFTVKVTVEITTRDENDVQATPFTKDFTINYDKADNAKYKSFNYYSFTGAAKVKVKIISIDSGAITWPVSKVLKLENTINAHRDYPFSCTIAIPDLSLQLDAANDELTANWNTSTVQPNPGITEYDLEWAWIDESAKDNYKDADGNYLQDLVFGNNATRVSITGMVYNIPLLYDDEGWIFVRVRPVQMKNNGQRLEGMWTWITNNNTQPPLYVQPVAYNYLGHEPDLNWQASTSYAEEGKRKSVVQYFDGSLRSRQTVTKDNSSNTTVVAESFYDYQGRAVIQVLPAPTLSSIIGYAHNFNIAVNEVEYPKFRYDNLSSSASVCSNPAPPFKTSTGTALYYSPNYLLQTQLQSRPEDKYIPDATDGTGNHPNEGYAFTETRLSPDGRVASQGGVGFQHQIGSNHETKYYYGNPAQVELDALFGTDAGEASHYFKNIVKDANGQYSVSYSDMHGRTVATALAGGTPKNEDGITDRLQSLSSQNPAPITRQLIDVETNRVIDNKIISSKTIVALKDARYNFKYDLDPEKLKLLNCNGQEVCYDCMYTLNITITSDCDKQPVFTKEVQNFTIGQYPNQCGTPNGFHLPIPDPNNAQEWNQNPGGILLAEGSYTVTKTLTLSYDAQDAYREIFLGNDTCKHYIDFYNKEYQALLASSNCGMTCQSCQAAIGNDFTGFVTKFKNESGTTIISPELNIRLQAAFNEAKTNCDAICKESNHIDDGMDGIRSIEQMMLEDVTPPYGQYAKPQQNTWPYNIFKVSDPSNAGAGELYPSNTGLPDYLNPIQHNSEDHVSIRLYNNYYDEFNQVDHSIDVVNNPPSVQQFIHQFNKKAWPKQLLPHHPEYLKLLLTKSFLKPTYQFEADLNKDTTWAQAAADGYINDLLNYDPFFNSTLGLGSVYKATMGFKILNFVAVQNSGCPQRTPFGHLSMWQIALGTVFCRDKAEGDDLCNTDTKVGCMLERPLVPATVHPAERCDTDWDWAWKIYKGMYLAERRKYISTYLNFYAPVFPPAFPNNNVPPYQLRFLDYASPANIYNNMGASAIGDIINRTSSNINDAVGDAHALVNAQYAATCHAYANTWIAQLEACPQVGTMSQADKTWLTTQLELICTAGADEGHPTGSSTVKPNSPGVGDGPYTEFPKVVEKYLLDRFNMGPEGQTPYTAECFPWLITVPAPYDRQPALANSYIVTKPNNCECKNLITLRDKFNESVRQGFVGNFSEYMQYNGTYITQGKLDTLTALCEGTFACSMLPRPITIPAALQCRGEENPPPSCISCDEYRIIKKDFEVLLERSAPIAHPQNDDEVQLNYAFANYANFRTGFSKRWAEYVAFENTCNGSENGSDDGIECTPLNAALHDFYLTPQYLQNPTGLTCMQVFVAYFNAKFNVVYTYQKWMLKFQKCGPIPEVCKPVITCSSFSALIDEFYTVNGVQVYKNTNCQLLFVSFINGRLTSNYTYSELEDIYRLTCQSDCGLNICSFPNHFLLTRVYNAFKAAHNGHPRELPNCQDAFTTYFNSYFGLSSPWDFTKIQDVYNSKEKEINSCVPFIDDLCNPPYTCEQLTELVNSFYNTNEPISELVNCQEKFAAFFNVKMGTNYTYAEIAALYLAICHKSLALCEIATDCKSLISFVTDFSDQHPPKDMTGASCQLMFINAFNARFGTSYTDFEEIKKLYDKCEFKLDICGGAKGDRVIEPKSLTGFLDIFRQKYPDPGTQLKGGDCQKIFAAMFNEQFKSAYSYSDIEAYYLAQTQTELNVCETQCNRLTTFITGFNSRYSNLTLPAAAREALFTWAYNTAYIKAGTGLKNDLQLQWATNDNLEEIAKSSGQDPKTFKPVISFEELRKTMEECGINAGSIAQGASASVNNPQVLISLKQVYYVMHPYGMPDDCEKRFAGWFNRVMQTKYEYKELFNLYNTVSGNNSGYICSMPTSENGKPSVIVRLIGETNEPNPALANLPPLLCGLSDPVNDIIATPLDDICKDPSDIAFNSAIEKYNLYLDSLRNVFDTAYHNKCMAAQELESFTVTYVNNEYHYTLYYYDQAGNLVMTVPPAGVNRFTSQADLNAVAAARANVLKGELETANKKTPVHSLKTEYRYNTLNQVVTQKTPDADVSNFAYDRLGRLVLSQNAKQILGTGKASYTLYDDLGRIKEVGQLAQSGTMPNDNVLRDPVQLDNWLSSKQTEEITKTFYDEAYTPFCSTSNSILCQQNLRNRVSYTYVEAVDDNNPATWNAATFYSYDIHGNVDVLLQDYGISSGIANAMNTTGNRWKKLEYDYDLISGKVNEVAYQPEQIDAFYHRYSYDAENRLTDVETSTDKLVWEKDARYSYYKHGPLARTILGQLQVQGIDYAYTLQGWLKGVNSTSVGDGSFDIAKDGNVAGVNSNIARDTYGYSLNYFNGDYKPIQGSVSGTFASVPNSLPEIIENGIPDGVKVGKDLFNGNIRAMLVSIPIMTNNALVNSPQLYGYQYDQLNRIVAMNSYNNFDNSGNTFPGNTPVVSKDYKERIEYDPNGNILKYIRNGDAARQAMDLMHYTYKPNTNKLDKVVDDIVDVNGTVYDKYNDIRRGQSDGNYRYDEIGNLTGDVSEGITNIDWTVYGKIKTISKGSTTISYSYDASGNRISKDVNGKITYYVRDASGNVMSIYSKDATVNNGDLTQTELHLYGSSRLGVYNVNTNVQTPVSNINGFVRGNKLFELSNHLQNVLVTISDKKIGVDANSDVIIDYYTADVITANDYYPGGMMMPGRKYSASSSKYRYGFNGKENDNEVKGEGNQQDYGMRIYDPRLVRFLSVDPLSKKFPYYTPYQYAGNSPIANIDLDGLEEVHYIFVWVKSASGKEVVLKLGGEMVGTPTGKVDANGIMTYKEPYKIYAHYPAQAFGETHLVTATYNSEEEFQNAKASDFYKDAILVGSNKGAEIAMHFGDLMAIGYITTSLAAIGREAVALYVEQKLAQYSANLMNKQVLQELISQNIRQQILKSGLTAEAKLAAIESGTEGAHFLSRHGAQTSLQQQLTRATTGLTPDGVAGKAVASSRFLTHDIELEALEKAQAAYTPALAGKGTVINMGKVVGEGYLKGGGAVKTSTSVQVYYNNAGEITTMFPLLPK